MSMPHKKRRVIGYQLQEGSEAINLYKCKECTCYFPSLKSIHDHFTACVDSSNKLPCCNISDKAQMFSDCTVKSFKLTSVGPQLEDNCMRLPSKTESINKNQVQDEEILTSERKYEYLENKTSSKPSQVYGDSKEPNAEEECSFKNSQFESGINSIKTSKTSCRRWKCIEETNHQTLINSLSIGTKQHTSKQVQGLTDSLLDKPSTEIKADEDKETGILQHLDSSGEMKNVWNNSYTSKRTFTEFFDNNEILQKEQKNHERHIPGNCNILKSENEQIHETIEVEITEEEVKIPVPRNIEIKYSASSIDNEVTRNKMGIENTLNERLAHDKEVNHNNETLSISNLEIYVKNEESGECFTLSDISSVNTNNKGPTDNKKNHDKLKEQRVQTENISHPCPVSLNECEISRNCASVSKTTAMKLKSERSHDVDISTLSDVQNKRSYIGQSDIFECQHVTHGSMSWQVEKFSVGEGEAIIFSTESNDRNMVNINKDRIYIQGKDDNHFKRDTVQIQKVRSDNDGLDNMSHEVIDSDTSVNISPEETSLSRSVVNVIFEKTSILKDEVVSPDKVNFSNLRRDHVSMDDLTLNAKDSLTVETETEWNQLDKFSKNCKNMIQVGQQSEEMSIIKNGADTNLNCKKSFINNVNDVRYEKPYAEDKRTKLQSANNGNRYSFRKRVQCNYRDDNSDENQSDNDILDSTCNYKPTNDSRGQSFAGIILKKHPWKKNDNAIEVTLNRRCEKTRLEGTSHKTKSEGTSQKIRLEGKSHNSKLDGTCDNLCATDKTVEENVSTDSHDLDDACYICDKCDIKFTPVSCYINHLILFHHPSYTRKDLIKCPCCKTQVSDSYFNSSLKGHISQVHLLDEMECLRCKIRFDTYIDLHRHIVVCNKELNHVSSLGSERLHLVQVQCRKCKCFHVYKPSEDSDNIIKDMLKTLPNDIEVNSLKEKFETIKKGWLKQTSTKFRCSKCNNVYAKLPCAVNHAVCVHMKDYSVKGCSLFCDLSNQTKCDLCQKIHRFSLKKKYRNKILKQDNNNHISSNLDLLKPSDKKVLSMIKDGLIKYFGLKYTDSYNEASVCRECNIPYKFLSCKLMHLLARHFDILSKETVLEASLFRRTDRKCFCKTMHLFAFCDTKRFRYWLFRAFDGTIDDESISMQDEKLSVMTNLALMKLKEVLVPENQDVSFELQSKKGYRFAGAKSRKEVSREMVHRVVYIDGTFYCQFCHLGFKQVSCCKNHVLTEHENYYVYLAGSEVYTCPICMAHFHRLHYLNIHLEQYHNFYKFTCMKCDKKFNAYNQDHLKSCKSFIKPIFNESLSCKDCGYTHNCMVYDEEENLIKSYSSGNEPVFDRIRNVHKELSKGKRISSDKKNIPDVVDYSLSDIEEESIPEVRKPQSVDMVENSKEENLNVDQYSSQPDDEDHSKSDMMGGTIQDGEACSNSEVVQRNALEAPKGDLARGKENSSKHHMKAGMVNDIRDTDNDRLEHIEPKFGELTKICKLTSPGQRKGNFCDIVFDGSYFHCLFCLEKFEDFACCFTHASLQHLSKRVFKCSICQRTNIVRSSYISHLKTKHNLDSSYCGQCYTGFVDNILRDKHAVNCNNTKVQLPALASNNICKKCFHVHLVSPDSDMRSSCKECELGFASIACAKNHFFVQHFPSLVILSSFNTMFRCPCGKVVLTKAELNLHLQTDHRSNQSTQVQGTEFQLSTKKGFECLDFDHHFTAIAEGKCVGCEHFHIIDSNTCKMNLSRKSTCTLCKVKFSASTCLKNHILSNHEGKYKIRQCVGCNLYFSGLEMLLNHQKKKNFENEYGKSMNAGGENNRRECQRSIDDLKCNECGKLHEHKFIVEELKLYNAKSPLIIKEEMIKDLIVPTREQKCSFCGIEVDTRKELMRHFERYHKRIEDKKGDFCQVCKKQIDGNVYYSEHLKEEHCDLKFVEGEILDDFSRRLSCLYCEETFSFIIDAQMHLRLKHFEKPMSVRKHLKPDTMGLFYKGKSVVHCPLCLKYCWTTLKTHINRHFSEVAVSKEVSSKKHVCDICGKIFNKVATFKRHKDKHNGIRRYICKICQKSFTYESNLETHYLVHKEKKHECKVCKMKFRLPHHVRAHMQRKHQNIT